MAVSGMKAQQQSSLEIQHPHDRMKNCMNVAKPDSLAMKD
jgi:hypothetical protein